MLVGPYIKKIRGRVFDDFQGQYPFSQPQTLARALFSQVAARQDSARLSACNWPATGATNCMNLSLTSDTLSVRAESPGASSTAFERERPSSVTTATWAGQRSG